MSSMDAFKSKGFLTVSMNTIQMRVEHYDVYFSGDIKPSRTSSARSAVLEWQVVTVAWFHRSRSCIGAPTILLRPITTALFPATDTPAKKNKNSHSLDLAYTLWEQVWWSSHGTRLSDQFHAAIGRAGDEAVTQVTTRQLPRIYARESTNICKQTHDYVFFSPPMWMKINLVKSHWWELTMTEGKRGETVSLIQACGNNRTWVGEMVQLNERESLTRLRPSPVPRHWWPSLCPSCGSSQAAAGQWARGQMSPRSPRWYCEEPRDGQSLDVIKNPRSIPNFSPILRLGVNNLSLFEKHRPRPQSQSWEASCAWRWFQSVQADKELTVVPNMSKHLLITMKGCCLPLPLPSASCWCKDLNHHGLRPAETHITTSMKRKRLCVIIWGNEGTKYSNHSVTPQLQITSRGRGTATYSHSPVKRLDQVWSLDPGASSDPLPSSNAPSPAWETKKKVLFLNSC